MNTNRLTLTCLAICASLIYLITPARAHDTWITVDAFQAAKNTVPGYTVVSSHRFPAPAEDVMDPERLEELFFISPSSRRISEKGPFTETGTFLAVAIPVNGFATKNPDGYQRGKNKKEVDSPILCRNSMKFAKAVFTIGTSGGQAYAKPLGHAMEIIPLKDPATLKAGDILPVKVLKEGKPARTYVFGTFEGFSKEANTFAYTTRTDKEGIAGIRLIHDGIWLLIAKHEEPYPDTSVCDVQRLAASLTFNVK